MLKCLETWLNNKFDPPAPEQVQTDYDRGVYQRLAVGLLCGPFRNIKEQRMFRKYIDAACKEGLTTKIQFVCGGNAIPPDLQHVVCSDFAGSKQRMMTVGEFMDDVEYMMICRLKIQGWQHIVGWKPC